MSVGHVVGLVIATSVAPFIGVAVFFVIFS
jgi:hypothetical protein